MMNPRMPRWFRVPTPSTLFYVAVAVIATAPAWIVRYPPLEDLPFHVATLRQIHSFHDPQFDFPTNFYVNLGNTQYVLYYVVADLLSYLLGVRYASVAMICLYLGGTPLALRALLRAFRQDERLSLFVIPVLFNTMFVIGLLPYLVTIPLMLVAWAVAVHDFERPTWQTAAWLALLTVAMFFGHVVMYAVFGIGFAAMFPWSQPRRWLRAGAPVVPSLLCVAWWILRSPQGQESFKALGAGGQQPHAPDEALRQIGQWTCDVFHDATDEVSWLLAAAAAAVTLALAKGSREKTSPHVTAFAAVPIACSAFYFLTGDSLGDVWLFAQRFPLPAAITFIPFLRMPTGSRGRIATCLVLAVVIWSVVNTCQHFVRFQLDEVGEFDEAIEKMQPNKHVAALIYDRGSHITKMAPFLHFGSYYQADKGGVIQFSNSGALYWPVRFLEGRYPPPGRRPRLRWEWTPEQVPVSTELYPYYDYVLTRGYGFNPPEHTFRLLWRGSRWAVYARE